MSGIKKSSFKLRSGNKPVFKQIGSSPVEMTNPELLAHYQGHGFKNINTEQEARDYKKRHDRRKSRIHSQRRMMKQDLANYGQRFEGLEGDDFWNQYTPGEYEYGSDSITGRTYGPRARFSGGGAVFSDL